MDLGSVESLPRKRLVIDVMVLLDDIRVRCQCLKRLREGVRRLGELSNGLCVVFVGYTPR